MIKKHFAINIILIVSLIIASIKCLPVISNRIAIYNEQQRQVVAIPKQNNKSLFFYRDDCPECRKVYPRLFWENFSKHNTVFINVNQSKNRHYLSQYDITAVPTIVNGNERYTGTNYAYILKTINKNHR